MIRSSSAIQRVVLSVGFLSVFASSGCGELSTARRFEATCGNSVRVTWDPTSEALTGYYIYRGTQPGVHDRIGEASYLGPATAPIYTISGMDIGTYYIAVTAYNASGESLKSNEISVNFTSCNQALLLDFRAKGEKVDVTAQKLASPESIGQ